MTCCIFLNETDSAQFSNIAVLPQFGFNVSQISLRAHCSYSGKMSTAAACFVLSSDRRFEAFVDVGGLTGFAVGCTLLEEVRSLCSPFVEHATLCSCFCGLCTFAVVISFGAIYLPVNGWVYFGIVVVLLSIAYVLFKMKYYCLHEAYLQTKR